MGALYFVMGIASIVLGISYANRGYDASTMFTVGGIALALSPIFMLWGLYAEGKAKLAGRYNKLVREEMKPAEFIKEYETLVKSPDLVVNKPGSDVLVLLTIAYDCLGDRKSALRACDKAISAGNKKDKTRALLAKVSLLFSYDKKDEAERILEEVEKSKLDLISRGFIDMIRKDDRAMALGDYRGVVSYLLTRLEQKFPKLDNMSLLVLRHRLATAYEKLGETENAITNYRFCVDLGGETEMNKSAKEALERLK